MSSIRPTAAGYPALPNRPGKRCPCQLPAPVRFEGATHNLSGSDKTWLSANGLRAYLRFQPTPYLGNLPAELRALCPENPRRVLEDLDRLAEEIRNIGFNDRGSYQLAGKPISLIHLGAGCFGQAFALKPENSSGKDDAPFVFKVYHQTKYSQIHHFLAKLINRINRPHGSYAENSSGVRYGKQPIKNKARYYCGNPVAGWMMNERITPDMDPKTRPGLWMHELGIRCRDSHNNINRIVFDEGAMRTGVNLRCLPPDMRKEAYDWIMRERPEFVKQRHGTAK